MAADLAGLKEFLGIPPATTTDEAAMQSALDAANDYVSTLRPDLTGAEPWPNRVNQAAKMEAARLYGRRGSTSGIAAYADIGITFLGRMDPDFRSLLELGEYQPSVVA